MSALKDRLSGRLCSWADISERYRGAGLLIGNGASCAVWDRFGYKSLFKQALSNQLDHSLDATDQEIFTKLETENFETVLSALSVSRIVGEALRYDISPIIERYENVRNALIAAVYHVHVVPEELSGIGQEMLNKTLRAIRDCLRSYKYVFTTNYDLLLYWAIMSEAKGEGFKDFLWYGRFDIADTEISDDSTRVLYLHGGLHLIRRVSGQVMKLEAEPGRSLLYQFAHPPYPDSVPLFVSEGTAQDKERVIHSSDYLTFALDRFAFHSAPLIIFGHRLDTNDEHLVRAMRQWDRRDIAISIRPSTADSVEEHQKYYAARLPHANLTFFDATTHPLGTTSLNVSVNGGKELENDG